MSWNGAGSFNRIYSWVADKAAGLHISSVRMDADSNDIAANGFGNCLTRDGQGQPTANLPMASFRHTGVGNGIARSDYASLGQVADGTVNWAIAGGSADALTATLAPALTTLADGQLVFLRGAAANVTTTPTFAPNGQAVRIITRAGGAALAPGDIPGANAELVLRYNLANTRWELLNPATLVPGSNSITTAMLQAAAVTYAKIQNVVSNNRLLGRVSGAGGSVEEISVGGGLNFSGGSLVNNAFPSRGAFANLSIKVATNTTVAVAADSVTMFDGSAGYRSAAISATCDLGSNAAVNRLDTGTIAIDTWYYIWAISNGTTDGTLASTSSTSPTLPGGYTFKARIGAVRTIHASATLYGTWQFGRRAQYVVGLAQTAALPLIVQGAVGTYSATNPTWSSQTVQGNSGQTAFVPSTASEISLVAAISGFKGGSGTIGGFQVAPNNSYKGSQDPGGNIPLFDNEATTGGINTFDLVLEGTTLQTTIALTNSALVCRGWLDNI